MKLILLSIALFAIVSAVDDDDCHVQFRGLPIEGQNGQQWTAGQDVSFYGQWADASKTLNLQDKYTLYVKGNHFWSGKAKAQNVTYGKVDAEGSFKISVSLADDLDGKYIFLWKKFLLPKLWTNTFTVAPLNSTAQ